MCNRAVEHNMAAFSELSLAVRWRGRLIEKASITSNSANLQQQ